MNSDSVQINFTLKEYDDVAVEVLDEAGKVIRHLGAGVLGPNAPLPFQPDTRAQKIFWDWKDNSGSILGKNGNFRIMVNVDLKARFGNILGWNGQWLGTIQGMVVDSAGNLYVIMKDMPIIHRWPVYIKVFSKDGSYLRSIAPFPANLEASKMNGVKQIEVSPDKKVPFVYNPRNWSVIPRFGVDYHKPVLNRSGKLVFPIGHMHYTKSGELLDTPEGAHVASIGIDGGVDSNYFGQRIARPEQPYIGSQGDRIYPRIYFALSPDERYLYASGIVNAFRSPDPAEIAERTDNVVYRIDMQSSNDAEVFIGEKWASGSDNTHLSNPMGIDVDNNGNIYICDRGNNRIAIFDSLGNFINALAIDEPVQIGVHSSGKLYVHCASYIGYQWNATTSHRLIRLGGINNPTREIELEFNKVPYSARGLLALDKNSDPPVLWLGGIDNVEGVWDGRHTDFLKEIFKIVDNGSGFENLGNVVSTGNPDKRMGETHKYITVDRETEEVWWDDMIFDGNTGRYIRTFIHSDRYPWEQKINGEPELGPENSVYIWEGYDGIQGSSIKRYHMNDGTPFNFNGLGTNSINLTNFGIWGGGGRPRGMTVSGNGDMYLIHHLEHRDRNNTQVSVIDGSGNLKGDKIIRIESSCGGIGVDKKGSIYIGANLKPFGTKMPFFFESFINNNNFQKSYELYHDATGSLIKFSSDGGTVLSDASGTDFESFIYPGYKADGAVWSRFDYSSQQTKLHTQNLGCACETPRHDVDAYNRSFIPDPLTFSIGVYDENGNLVTRFGNYGNMDSRGPGSLVPVPEIPFSYPLGVAVSDKAAYVNDVYGHRIVRADLYYRQTGYADIGTVRNVEAARAVSMPMLMYHNPFRPGDIIRYYTPLSDESRLAVYNIHGRLVRCLNLLPSGYGAGYFPWDGKDNLGRHLPKGVYFIKMRAVESNSTFKAGTLVLF
ncbi:MAG: FlgD immunoglobulin-like domain containing protein [bacterium]